MPRLSIARPFRELQQSLASHQGLLAATRPSVRFFRLEQVAELCLVRLELSWEAFLEETFARFLCGAPSLSGVSPIRFATPRNLEHARDLMIGLERVRRYSDWTDPQTVIDRADLLFKDGAPFVSPIRAAFRDLNDMKTMRNCIAHRSDFARAQFQKVVLGRYGVAHNWHPGRFLLRLSPGGAITNLEFFSNRVLLVAQQIVG